MDNKDEPKLKREPAPENDGKKTWKSRVDVDIDLEKLQTLDMTGKITYLALCGWRIEKEMRSGNYYLYAIKYINRKKQRIYLGKEMDIDTEIH